MNESQHHRGPDGGGLHVEPGLGLGHRRLSIIDLAGGHQPIFNEDGTVATIFNGEIYNYKYLAAELTRAGHVFRTDSDTEVIVHAWEEWGSACVNHFRGMFAFALWDRKRETLFLARDRLGVKPLFYAFLSDGYFVFGSELKSLLVHYAFRREIDPVAVEQYFALGYVAEPRTIFRETYKLPPAHTLTLARGDVARSPRRYWDIRFQEDPTIGESDACAETLARLEDSIRLRTSADVPLGAFLSGGVDSSAIVATMARLSSEPINTCSIAFDEPAFDESRYASMVARRYATRHRSQTVDSRDYSLLDVLSTIYDEPFADSSAIPMYRLSQLARSHVKVALSGDGADESFAGYRRYRLHLMEERVRSALPLRVRRPLFSVLGYACPKADWAPRVLRGKTTFEALARDSVEAYFNSVSLMREPMRNALFSKSLRAELAGYSALHVFRDYAQQAQTDDALSLIQYIDLHTYLVGDINTKVDRASMAHSLEVREPMMDHLLIEWLARVPSALKLRRGVGKFLLKRAMECYLPQEVLYRPKMGFSVPLASWFRGPLRARVRRSLLQSKLAETGFFDLRYIRRIVDAHESGLSDHSAAIWSLLVFDGFLTKVFSDKRAGTSVTEVVSGTG